tara:strand:+ start:778 stop:1230 length:453 start_codon:yes stop_codon:yes gene_type:complete
MLFKEFDQDYHYDMEHITKKIVLSVKEKEEVIFSDEWYEEFYKELHMIIDTYAYNESIKIIRKSVNEYGVFKALSAYEDQYGEFYINDNEDINYRELSYFILYEFYCANIKTLIKEHIESSNVSKINWNKLCSKMFQKLKDLKEKDKNAL